MDEFAIVVAATYAGAADAAGSESADAGSETTSSDKPTDVVADSDVTVATDAAKADAAAAIAVAIAPPPPAPANTRDAKPAIDPTAIAAVDVQDVAAQAGAGQSKAPAAGDAEADSAKPQIKADSAATASVATATAEEAPAANAAFAAVLSDVTEKKDSAAPAHKAEGGKTKAEHDRVARADGVEHQAATDAPKAATDTTGDQPKAPAAQQPRAATEHAAPRPAATEARAELPAAPAASAQVNTPAPMVPLHLAMNASPLAAMSPLAALRVDNTADNAIPVAGLAVEIVARASEGSKRFDIRLDPPELGRIDVRLDVDTNGKVTSRLVVERSETLDLLKRDAPQLERALQHAGLNTEGGLQFSLRDQSSTNQDQTQREAPATRLIVSDEEIAVSEAARRGYGRMIGLGGGVDIRV